MPGNTAYVGRYAPSPTGDLHLGNALAAVVAVARARRVGGRVLLRIEDLDQARVVEGAAERIVEDLAALSLSFDGATLVQSTRLAAYQAALDALKHAGLLYACRCSRKDLDRLASAPHAGDEGPIYPGTCRELGLPFDDPRVPVSVRVRAPDRVFRVDDRLQPALEQNLARDVGDFVVKRKDGQFAYQLAVVVDDAASGITEVVRGCDLLSSTPRQLYLFEALGFIAPAYAHIPLWVDEHGHRLSKRGGDHPTLLRALFNRGDDGPRVLGRIARALGVDRGAVRLSLDELTERLDDDVLRRATVAGGVEQSP